MNIHRTGLALLLLGGVAFPAEALHWSLEQNLASTGQAPLTGTAGVFQTGSPPVFDAATAAAQIWDGSRLALAHPDNQQALRFRNEGAAGAGNPTGGEVAVAAEPRVQPPSLTVEAFVRMDRQMPRHALIASKRRGQNGATWSLSIDPEGQLRARFDTQPEGSEATPGSGFNQSFGSSGSLADGAWHHVALTFDETTRSAALFLDHVRCGGGVTKGPLVYGEGALVFGRGLDGWLDEIRLSPEALHPEQFLRPCRFFSDLKPRLPVIALLDQTPTRVQPALKPAWPKTGTLRPKRVPETGTSMWSLGCETLDRGLADWDAYRNYLQPLGIKRIRLQGGWNRTETKKGEYDFAWLDRIVDDALSLGLEICLETSYNNRLYEPDGATGPGGRLPQGEETLAAWDRWVEAMVRRYSAKGVKEWMMYNEPNLLKANTPELIVANNVRTAEIIKRIDPQARIGAFVLAGLRTDLIRTMLEMIRDQGKLHLFHWAIYHGYSGNPDLLNQEMARCQAMLAEVAPDIKLWQGEAGCASEEVQYALSGIDWTEYSHAKWNARRMLCDLGHGIESSVFTISDVSYHKDFISRYGLLKTNPDNSIIKVKTAYYAVQNVVSLFNDALEPAPAITLTVTGTDKELTRFAFRDKNTGLSVLTFWDGTEIPSNSPDLATVQLTVTGGRFQDPVWVDLLTGHLHAIPPEQMLAGAPTVTFREVPVSDGPSAIADRSLLSFEPARIKAKPAGAKLASPRPEPRAAPLPLTPHLLPGTQQPAPAVLICASPEENASPLVAWLHAQEVHAFVLPATGEQVPRAKLALQAIRGHAPDWQVRSGSVGVLGLGAAGAATARALVDAADFAVLLLPDEAEAKRQEIPEPQRRKVFTGRQDQFESTLSAWLEPYKGRVF